MSPHKPPPSSGPDIATSPSLTHAEILVLIADHALILERIIGARVSGPVGDQFKRRVLERLCRINELARFL